MYTKGFAVKYVLNTKGASEFTRVYASSTNFPRKVRSVGFLSMIEGKEEGKRE